MMIYINQFDIVISSLNDTQRVQLYADETFGKINGANRQILVATDDYVVMKTTDRKMKEEYLTLNGTLNDGSSVYMRTAVESLKESASITNRFFLWVGCASLILSLGVIYYISKRISRPIQELTTISKRMSELEFDAKYSRPDYATLEIDELGVNMNQLSKILEETISELKSANVELQHDIEKKEKIDEGLNVVEGISKAKKLYKELTFNAKLHSYKQNFAVLKAGTKVTCLEIKKVENDIWLRIPSGWIAGYYDEKILHDMDPMLHSCVIRLFFFTESFNQRRGTIFFNP